LKAGEGMPDIIGLIKMCRKMTLSVNRARLKIGQTVTFQRINVVFTVG
jgi:hypothetical protein